eukprot:EG_transcript_31232
MQKKEHDEAHPPCTAVGWHSRRMPTLSSPFQARQPYCPYSLWPTVLVAPQRELYVLDNEGTRIVALSGKSILSPKILMAQRLHSGPPKFQGQDLQLHQPTNT